MLSIEPRKSDQGFNIWHAMTHSFRAPGSFRFTFGFGVMAVIAMILLYVIIGGLFAVFAGNALAGMMSGDFTGFGGGTFALIALFYIIFLLAMIFFSAVIESGMHRRMLGLQTGGFPFRLGQDEKNVFVALLGVYGLFILIYFVGGLIMALLAGLLGQATPILAAIPMIIFGVLMAMFAVKLSPAAALTVLNKKPHVLAALQVSKHRSWSIFFTWLLLMVFFYIVIFLVAAVTIGPAALMGTMSADPTAIASFGGGASILFFFIMMAFCIFSIPMWMGIGSYIVKHWAGGDLHQASVFE